MKKDIFIYGLSTAINKGSVLLFFPIIIQFLSLADFGKWSLAMLCINLLLPLISLNGAAGILREGSVNKDISKVLAQKFTLLAIILGGFIALVGSMLSLEPWVEYGILIAITESMLLLSLTYLRTIHMSRTYLAIVSLKTVFIFCLVLFAQQQSFSLDLLLFAHFILSLIFTVVVSSCILVKHSAYRWSSVPLRSVLWFSILLIPHSLSQWVVSSSDRFILEYMLGSEAVGIYSVAYSLAMILMLINSGLAMVLPTYLIKNHKKWFEADMDNVVLRYYTVLSASLFVIICGLYWADKTYFRILGFYGDEIIPLLVIIYLSIYILGIYYLFANHLFYHKKAGLISKVTFLAAGINIILTVLFIPWLGVTGAALATLVTYTFYMLKMRDKAMHIEPRLNITLLKKESVFLVSFLFVVFVLSSFWGVSG